MLECECFPYALEQGNIFGKKANTRNKPIHTANRVMAITTAIPLAYTTCHLTLC